MFSMKLFIFIKTLTLSNSICSTIVFTRKLLKSCSSLSVTVKKKNAKIQQNSSFNRGNCRHCSALKVH